MKTCFKCKQEKDAATEFYKNKQAKDGLSCYCKECHKAISRSRQKRIRPSVLGIRKPSGIVQKETKRRRLIVKYGLDYVETLESVSDAWYDC